MTRTAGIILFLFGLLLTLALAVAAIWPDLEANLFDPGRSAEETLDSLRCPLAITVGEPAHIEVTFTNSLEEEVRFLVRSRISQGYVSLMRESQSLVELPPGETETLQWPVAADDAAFGRLILARVYAFRGAGVPSRQQSCGILVLGIPGLSGGQVVGLALVASLLSLGLGTVLWWRDTAPLTGEQRNTAGAAGALAALVLLAMFVGMAGLWALGVLLIIFAVLLVAAMIERFR